MSVLARYRKPGGFKQLLQLIETSQPVKQQKLLEAVEKEDPSWANLIREKKITREMVLSWDIQHLVVIFEHMTPRHSACLLKVIEEEKFKACAAMFRPEKYRDLKMLMDDTAEPSEGEVISAGNNMLETVRYLDEEKKINLRFIDPVLDLSEAA